eukprot:TRINITY_DN35581_c0_g1_i1.p1 TRINITY_DN35581_c0_g1~~TRINITY_DN35581_c0_g1_i1.p1  ORF type:complete len:313 (+),score=59.00 TRINITY_DN35581_c0_g1_i1:81-1019(+)
MKDDVIAEDRSRRLLAAWDDETVSAPTFASNRMLALVMGSALLCAATYAAFPHRSSPFLAHDSTANTVQLAEDVSTFYFVESGDHIPNSVEFWQWLEAIFASETKAAEYLEAETKFGVHLQMFIPITRTGPMYMIFEMKTGKTKEDLEQYIIDKASPVSAVMGSWKKEVSLIDTELVGGIQNTGLPKPFFDNGSSRRLKKSEATTSTYYLVKHEPGNFMDEEAFWKSFSPEATTEFIKESTDAGLWSPLCLPLKSEDGHFFCFYEAEAGKTAKDLEEFLVSNKYTKDFVNTVMPIPAKLAGPMPPFIGQHFK